MPSAIERLLAHCSADTRAQLEAVPGIDSWLATQLEAVAQTWPGVAIPEDDFLKYLAERVPDDPQDALPTWALDDLYLSCACVRGDGRALQLFEQHFVPVIDAALRRVRLAEPLLEEARQLLREQLFVGDGQRKLLTRYTGAGRLRSWLWVVTARTARRLLGVEKRLVPVSDERLQDQLLADGPHPLAELPAAKARHLDAFKRSFKRAMGTLSPRQLNLMRYRYADGLGVQQIGAVYRVHHSTVSRWIEQVRQVLLHQTLALLVEDLGISSDECASIIRSLGSQLDVTLATFLGQGPQSEAD